MLKRASSSLVLSLLLSGIAFADDPVISPYRHFVEETQVVEANRFRVQPKLPSECEQRRYFFDPNNSCNFYECELVETTIEDVYDSQGRYRYTLRTCDYSCTLYRFALAPGC
jgi:hypothetical protein